MSLMLVSTITLKGLHKEIRLQVNVKGKGKAVPLKARSGPEGSRKLGFLDFMTTAQDGGKFVSLTHRPPGNHFC